MQPARATKPALMTTNWCQLSVLCAEAQRRERACAETSFRKVHFLPLKMLGISLFNKFLKGLSVDILQKKSGNSTAQKIKFLNYLDTLLCSGTTAVVYLGSRNVPHLCGFRSLCCLSTVFAITRI